MSERWADDGFAPGNGLSWKQNGHRQLQRAVLRMLLGYNLLPEKE